MANCELWRKSRRIHKKCNEWMINELMNSWERRSHCQNNFGNTVPRCSRWKRSLTRGLPSTPLEDFGHPGHLCPPHLHPQATPLWQDIEVSYVYSQATCIVPRFTDTSCFNNCSFCSCCFISWAEPECRFHNDILEVWSRSDVTTPRRASLAGCAREGHLQDGCHGVPLSSRSGTSVPRRPSHHILWCRFSASSAFRKPTPARRTSLSTQHIRPSGIFDRWSDGLELAAWRTQRSGVWFWQF